MTVEFVCDGCGKRARSTSGWKPASWFQRTVRNDDRRVETVELHACSRECIGKLGGLVLPV